MVSKIVVTDDGTEVSDRAIEQAFKLIKQLNARLTIIHVIDNIEVPATLILGNDRGAIEQAKLSIEHAIEKGWKERIRFLVEKLNKEIGNGNTMEIDYEYMKGNASEKILEFLDSSKPDIVVMGISKRLKGVSKIRALGSVTRKVSEMANCPVLIVH